MIALTRVAALIFLAIAPSFAMAQPYVELPKT